MQREFDSADDGRSGHGGRLPFGAGANGRRGSRRVIAHHLVLTGYGRFPNDIRGSGSVEVTQEKLGELGPIHYGRKKIQPSRQELSQFFRKAEPLLKFERFWFDHAKRQALGDAFGQVIANRYTVWACAICKNHAHLCIRVHRDPAEIMWSYLTDGGRKVIRKFADVEAEHEVWTRAPYTVFCYTPDDIEDRVEYIRGNPLKEGLPPQSWPFVQPTTGGPRDDARNEHPDPRREAGVASYQSWEQGTRRPGRGDLRLLQILDQRPQIVSEVIAASKTR